MRGSLPGRCRRRAGAPGDRGRSGDRGGRPGRQLPRPRRGLRQHLPLALSGPGHPPADGRLPLRDGRPVNGIGSVARELAAAAAGLVLAPARHAAALVGAGRRRRAFLALGRDELPPPPDPAAPPGRRLRRLVLSCGDLSGESHALRLLAALRRRHPGLETAGFGGRRLAAAGMEVWEPLADLNVMGFRDVAARLPLFLRAVGRFAADLAAEPPDAVVLIDYPGLNRHLLRIAGRAGVPVVDYIAPQLWAWAPWRIRDFRRADRLLTILPFEGPWYRARGARATYVGHPLGDGLAEAAAAEAPPPELDPTRTWVGILPGSRRREVAENLPVLLTAAGRLARRRPDLGFVLPHLRAELWPRIDALLAASPVEVVRAPGCFHAVLPALRAAWVASGTALLEVAAHRVPPVLVYGLSSRLAAFLHRRALSVPWVGSLNLIAGRPLVPEHVGRSLDPATLAADLEARLEGPVRERFLADLEPLLPRFAAGGAAARAAREVEAAAGGGNG
ncbi:MAG: hypothetical protein D6702_10895 [Planctomycetota bacterium]|nr:MAG: hypothetical protein D6702_10895 [Planctomycetota bacterium]